MVFSPRPNKIVWPNTTPTFQTQTPFSFSKGLTTPTPAPTVPIFGAPQNQQSNQIAQPQPNIFGQPSQPQQQQPFSFAPQNQTQTPVFGQPQPQVQQQQIQVTAELLDVIANYQAMVYQLQLQQHQAAQASQSAFQCPQQFLQPQNGSPILQAPGAGGRMSCFALKDGYLPISTPLGPEVLPPFSDVSPTDALNQNSPFGSGRRDNLEDTAFGIGYRLGRAEACQSLSSLRHFPTRQNGSTYIADPYIDHPYYLRPLSPALSSPSSTILGTGRANHDLKPKPLSWRNGYGGYYFEDRYRDADKPTKTYDYLHLASDIFPKKPQYEKFFPSLESSVNSKWKILDRNVLERHMDERCPTESRPLSATTERGAFTLSSSLTPRHRVKFFDPKEPKYYFYGKGGPPTKSYVDDNIADPLSFSNQHKAPGFVANLPGRFESSSPQPPLRSILKNSNKSPYSFPVQKTSSGSITEIYRYTAPDRTGKRLS